MITALDSALAILHDRGQINETEFEAVCAELLDTGHAPTRDQLSRIFGTAEIFHLCTIPDMTARQLVREAADAMFNPESPVNLKDWLQAAEAIVGPIGRRVDVEKVNG
jgi:hypothetical protein